MEITLLLENQELRTKQHIQDLPVSQILESETGDLFILIELWGMHENWLLLKADENLISEWKQTPVSNQGAFFDKMPDKWELHAHKDKGFQKVDTLSDHTKSYVNRRKFI